VLVAEGVRVLAAHAPQERVARVSLAVGVVLVPVALLPDLALGVGHRVEPADYPPAYDRARQLLEHRAGDVLVLPLSSYRAPAWNHRHLVLDPLGRDRGRDYVASDVLVVDGVPLSGEDPRVTAAAEALAEPTPQARAQALARIGIGAVAVDPTAPGDPPPEVSGALVLDDPDLRLVELDHVAVRQVQTSWQVAMGAAWLAFLGPFALALVGALAALPRRRRPATPDRRNAE
jgi:hypothetical protein